MDEEVISLLARLVPEAFRDAPVPVPPTVRPELGPLADPRRRVEFIRAVWTAETDFFEATDDLRLSADVDPGLATRIAEGGFEAIAWYVSFHQSPEYWGIYFDIAALQAFALRVFGSLRGQISDAQALGLAFRAVLGHELFHYRVDAAAAAMELAGLRPFYLPYRQRHPDLSSPGCQVEEALANAHARLRFSNLLPARPRRALIIIRSDEVMVEGRRIRRPGSTGSPGDEWLRLLEREMSSEPPGYRDWVAYKDPASFRAGRARLAAIVHAGGFNREPEDGPFGWFFRPGGDVPLYFVSDFPPQPELRFFVPYGHPIVILETPKFRKLL